MSIDNASGETKAEMDNRWAKFSENTNLSDQESWVATYIMYGFDKEEICERMSMSPSQYESIVHGRIPEKVEKSRETFNAFLNRSPLGSIVQEELVDEDASKLVGCAGEDCDKSINTDTNNPTFKNFFSKTINQHHDGRRMQNSTQVHFCSQDCLLSYDRKLSNR